MSRSALARMLWAFIRTALRHGAVSLFFLIAAIDPGCSCAGSTEGICHQACGGDASSTCPMGQGCFRGCCECFPVAETCDGVDQNCNARVDDGLEMTCACAPGGPGRGTEICNRIDDDCDTMIDEDVISSAEICNGIDDDCNAMIDDGLDPHTCACAPGGAGRGNEVCNRVDDDCDGMIDEGLAPACPCAAGGPGPSVETCNGVDDDCNAMIDDGLDPVRCACAPGGVGRGPETCNGRDDDCNGAIDDGTMLCGGRSACACASGGAGSHAETCNGNDDDCDGMVDEALMACACTMCGASGVEVCNALDDDCNGMADDGLDPMLCACAPGGPGRSMEICNGRDDDCDTHVDESSVTGRACAGFGDPCTANTDCSSTLCTGDAFDMYCTHGCTTVGDPGDCPSGYRCWHDPSVGGTNRCRRDYPRCGGNRDCASGYVCAPTCDDVGTAVVTECRPAIPAGVPAPSACTRDRECASNTCLSTGICTAVCASDLDCSTGYRCVLQGYPDCGGRGYVGHCLDACDCDTECPSSQLCQPYVHAVLPPATATTVGACDTSYGPLAPGAACNNAMGMYCAHAICSRSGAGFCTQVCSATCGCPTGIGPCGPSTVTFPNLGSYAAMTCGTM